MSVDLNLIRDTFGCDNCKHEDDGMALDYCERCVPPDNSYAPPSKYRPKRGSVQEKLWYDKPISEEDFKRFLRRGY